MKRIQHHYVVFDTASGACAIAWNRVGITCFQLPATNAAATERRMLHRLPGAAPCAPTPLIIATIAAVRRYFNGEKVDFGDFPLDLGAQSDFCKRIYSALRGVRWGETTSYGALAKELGAGPEAARDVGQAMASNPIPLLIPCHRVLAAGGKLGGFSAPGGAATKSRMLELEGIEIGRSQSEPGQAQRSLEF